MTTLGRAPDDFVGREPRSSVYSIGRGGLATLIAVFAAACAAPFSDYQSARTLEPGSSDVTASYTFIQASQDGEREKLQDNIGVQFARGLTDRVELRARYWLILPDGSDADAVSALGVGPKVSLAEDRVAFYSPVGLGFGGGIESGDSWQWQPTLLATFPVSEKVEVTASGKAQFWFDEFDDPNVAFNVGVGIGPDLDRWAIRPEVGILKNPGSDGGSIWNFGVGFTRGIGR